MKVYVEGNYENTKYIEFVDKKDADVCVYIDSESEGSTKEIHFSKMPTTNSKYISSPNNKTVVVLPKIPENLTKTVFDAATKIDNPNLENFYYCVYDEEISSINHFTHSYAVMCECLVFYRGCPNLETILPSDSFVRYTNQDDLMVKFELAVKENWWERNIDSIRKAKEIILKMYHLPAYINRIIEHELVLRIAFYYRFDIYAKIVYAKYPLSNYYRNVYRNHISIMNSGIEIDDGRYEAKQAKQAKQTKQTVGDFVTGFNTLIHSFNQSSFDSRYPIPLGSNNLISNGVHRLALSYVHKILPEYHYLSEKETNGYNYKCFNDMQPQFYNTMLFQACKEREDLILISIFPVADKKKDINIVEYLSKYGIVFATTNFKLNDKGVFNYVKECYRGENWATDAGIEYKVQNCKGKNKLRVCLFYSTIPIREIKDKMREIYGQRDSVHIPDTCEQKMRLAKILFHQNSFNFINNVIPKLSVKNQKQLDRFVNMSSETCAIDSSFVMSLYNLREANDLDYVCYNNTIEISDKDLDCHNKHFYVYEKTPIKTLLEDENNYFYYNGVKVLNLSFVQNMKQLRREGKDYKDLELIKTTYQSFTRGLFIVLEGPDCSGKTTHAKAIVEFLRKELKRPSEMMRFPNRETYIGKLLDSFLKKQIIFDEKTLALLFAANQREMQSTIQTLLDNGVNVICDRYHISGLVYREGCDEEWLKSLGVGLIQPDISLLFHPLFYINDQSEIYHTKEKQEVVWKRFQSYTKDMIQVYPSTIEKRNVDLFLFIKKLLN